MCLRMVLGNEVRVAEEARSQKALWAMISIPDFVLTKMEPLGHLKKERNIITIYFIKGQSERFLWNRLKYRSKGMW